MVNRAVILYFSGTGNTRMVAEKIGRALAAKDFNVEAISVEERERLEAADLSDCLVGVGYPCYAFDYPAILDDVCARLRPLSSPTPAFVFSTIGWSAGSSKRKLAGTLRHLNLYTIAMRGFICPNNGWITLFKPGHPLRRLTRYGKRFQERIESFGEEIIASLARFDRKPYCVSLLEWLAPVRFLLQRMQGIAMKGLYVETTKCIRCMQCVKNCPDGNIHVGADGAIAFKKPDDCIKCVRCISDCPVDAVVFGRLSRGKGRYTKKMRQEYITRYLGGS